jgi:hypothetical protein
VLTVMGPATLSSGMLQINVFVSLFFASGLPAAAAGLGYANLLVQTPLGLLSNALLVPLLPVYARLTAPADRPELIGRIRQGLMLSNASMLPLGAVMIALAVPIVALIYERGAFDNSAADLVGKLLMAYGLGMPAYLARDVLVRVFYALGDGVTPFRWSLAGIGLNAVFCWLFVGGPTPWGLQLPALNFGAPGLVLATVGVNVITSVGLLLALQLLITPGTSDRHDTGSRRLFGQGFLIDSATVTWFFDHAVPQAHRHDPRFAPLEAPDLEGVCPALVLLAECDPVVDDGIAYADRLRMAGVPVDLEIYRGVTHDFMKMGRVLPEAIQALDAAALALKGAWQV